APAGLDPGARPEERPEELPPDRRQPPLQPDVGKEEHRGRNQELSGGCALRAAGEDPWVPPESPGGAGEDEGEDAANGPGGPGGYGRDDRRGGRIGVRNDPAHVSVHVAEQKPAEEERRGAHRDGRE